jgi:hypothetical protein
MRATAREVFCMRPGWKLLSEALLAALLLTLVHAIIVHISPFQRSSREQDVQARLGELLYIRYAMTAQNPSLARRRQWTDSLEKTTDCRLACSEIRSSNSTAIRASCVPRENGLEDQYSPCAWRRGVAIYSVSDAIRQGRFSEKNKNDQIVLVLSKIPADKYLCVRHMQ